MFSRGTLPSISTLEKLCQAFGLTISQFFSEEQNQENEFVQKFNILDKREQKVILDLINLLNKK